MNWAVPTEPVFMASAVPTKVILASRPRSGNSISTVKAATNTHAIVPAMMHMALFSGTR